MNKNSFKIEGLSQVKKALSTLPQKMKGEILKQIHTKVGKEQVQKPLISSLPYSARSKKISVMGGKENVSEVYIGPTRDAYWLRFVEHGTKDRKSKSGATWKGISARNFIEPFVDSRVKNVIKVITNEYGSLAEESLMKSNLRRVKKIKKARG